MPQKLQSIPVTAIWRVVFDGSKKFHSIWNHGKNWWLTLHLVTEDGKYKTIYKKELKTEDKVTALKLRDEIISSIQSEKQPTTYIVKKKREQLTGVWRIVCPESITEDSHLWKSHGVYWLAIHVETEDKKQTVRFRCSLRTRDKATAIKRRNKIINQIQTTNHETAI